MNIIGKPISIIGSRRIRNPIVINTGFFIHRLIGEIYSRSQWNTEKIETNTSYKFQFYPQLTIRLRVMINSKQNNRLIPL